jgi:hypothetical protein
LQTACEITALGATGYFLRSSAIRQIASPARVEKGTVTSARQLFVPCLQISVNEDLNSRSVNEQSFRRALCYADGIELISGVAKPSARRISFQVR